MAIKSYKINGRRVEVGSPAEARRLGENPRPNVLDDPKNIGKNDQLPIKSPYVAQPKSSVGVISSEQGQNIFNEENKKHENDIRRSQEHENNQKIWGKLRAKESGQEQIDSGYTAEEAAAIGLDTTKAKYNEKTGTYTPTNKSPEQLVLEKQIEKDTKSIDDTFKTQEKYIDDATRSLLSSIKSIYNTRAQAQSEQIARAQDSLRRFGITSVASRYSGATFRGILSANEREGLRALDKIAVDEASAIAEAEQAKINKKYTLFSEKRSALEKIRNERQNKLAELQKVAIEEQEKIAEKTAAIDRDNAVSEHLTSGITDPKEILKKLSESGFTATAKDVAETMKNLAEDNDTSVDKLSGDIRDFFILQKEHSEVIPARIAALPKDQQLKAWIEYNKPVKAPGVGSINKITLSEAKSQGLPLSVVGLSETDVANSFNDLTPPKWFEEKANREAGAIVFPGILAETWKEYRQQYTGTQPKETPPTPYEKDYEKNGTKALQYFTNDEKYAGADEETLQSYVDRLIHYMDKGMSYADALAQTEKDIDSE